MRAGTRGLSSATLHHDDMITKISLDKRRNNRFVDRRWCKCKSGFLEGTHHAPSDHPSQTSSSYTWALILNVVTSVRWVCDSPFALSSEYSWATLLNAWPSWADIYRSVGMICIKKKASNLYLLEGLCRLWVFLTKDMTDIDSGCSFEGAFTTLSIELVSIAHRMRQGMKHGHLRRTFTCVFYCLSFFFWGFLVVTIGTFLAHGGLCPTSVECRTTNDTCPIDHKSHDRTITRRADETFKSFRPAQYN